MFIFDASSMLHAWDNYPIGVFPPLWKWIAERIDAADFTMPQCAYEECGDNSPDCQHWLDSCALQRHPLTPGIILHATAIKTSLNIVADAYHAKGVGENDIFIISTTKALSGVLVSNEAIQPKLPIAPAQYKIPAVCNLPNVGVHCVSFVELLNTMQPNLRSYAD